MIYQGAIETAMQLCEGCAVQRVVVLEKAQSTQDEAYKLACIGDSVLVVASKQTRGRGQRGSRWEDGDHETLACTFAIDAAEHDPCKLAAACGLAALHTVIGACPEATSVKIKWPNDVVVRGDDRDRKVGGVLIEIRDKIALIGIGINASQKSWTGALAESAISILQINGSSDRTALACGLLEQVSEWLNADDEQIKAAWASHDAMVSTKRVFLFKGERIEGFVESVDPLTQLCVRTNRGIERLDVRLTKNA